MPPPNITGQLHIGHSFFLTLQDTQIRFNRMMGRNTLWIPGTDHAGLATHEKILEKLMNDGIATPSRDQYENMASIWTQQTHSIITKQIRRMGASCDWSRESYTLDNHYCKATFEAFKYCYDNGMIYRKDNQWYMDISESAEQLLLDIIEGKIEIIPSSNKNQLLNFLNNIEPWSLSRQIWWGHRIPIWYDQQGNHCCAETQEDAEKQLGGNVIQDPDCLDTWFSSSLWPFAILGWPQNTQDYQEFYPASLIETADDILFFWCARMLMMGKILTKKYPFNTIYLHGLIRDKKGQKLSKSLGNGIDPLIIIERYGCDALRFGLLEHTSPGLDIMMNEDIFAQSSKFINKIWQASRFSIGHYKRNPTINIKSSDSFTLEINKLAKKIFLSLENYEFKKAATLYRNFFKHEFCDNYLESIKAKCYEDDQNYISSLIHNLRLLLIILHPMCPFISEKIWSYVGEGFIMEEYFHNNFEMIS